MTVQAGQTVIDIVLRYFGNTNPGVVLEFVADNADKLAAGSSTLLAPGLELYVRPVEEMPGANAAIVAWYDKNHIDVNSTYTAGDAIPGNEGEVVETEIETTPAEVIIGNISTTKAIFLHLGWREDTQLYCGDMQVIHENGIVEHALRFATFHGEDHRTLFETFVRDDNIILKARKAVGVTKVVLSIKIVTQLFF